MGLGWGWQLGVNTWLCIAVDGLSEKGEGSHLPRCFYNLLSSERGAFASDQTA